MILDSDGHQFHTDEVAFSPELNYGENEDFLKIFVLSYVKFLCDTPFGHDSKPLRVKMRFLRRLSNYHLLDTIRDFSSLADELLSTQYSTGGDSTTGVFIQRFKETPIFWEYHHWHTTRDPELLEYILSFLLFGKKLKYVDPEFNATAFRGWLEVEDSLSELSFSDHDTGSLATIIEVLLGDIQVDTLLPKHGSGKVAERDISDIYDKVDNLAVNAKIAYAFHRERPYWTNSMGFGVNYALRHNLVADRPARLKFVPKDITKSRSICMEPSGTMYYQQEVLRWLAVTMRRSHMGRFVTMDDQTRNQIAAVNGSISLASDTLDLSSASDSVSVELVRRAFNKVPRLKFLLLATRTSRAETPRGVVELKKFAPMGSACCFPVQCIIFTAICMYSYLSYEKGTSTGSWTCSREDVLSIMKNGLTRDHSVAAAYTRRLLPPVVYGDDLIIDHRCYDIVATTLARLGFRLNESKSFKGSQSFRESCGVYAYNGFDVTPFRFQCRPIQFGRKWDTSVYASLIENVNNARAHGYYSVASFLQSVLTSSEFRFRRGGPVRVPFVTDCNSFGILVSQKHEVPAYDLRWNADLQIHEERVLGIVPRELSKESPDDFDDYSLAQWWRSRVRDKFTLEYKEGSRPRPQETRLAPVWSRCEE